MSQRNPHANTRTDKRALVCGEAHFIGDLTFPGMAMLAVLRSPHAHAAIGAIDTHAAWNVPGVLAVLTAHDLPPAARDLPAAPGIVATLRQPVLASEIVRYAGEPVAAVVATDTAAAAAACRAMRITYCPLTAVMDIEAALTAPDTPRDHALSELSAASREYGFGDITEAFAQAALVLSERFTIPRQCALPLEPRGAVAVPAGDELTLYTPTQLPHRMQTCLAQTLGIATEVVRVRVPYVGGSFGAKQLIYSEDILVALAARRLNRPVRWLEGKSEHLSATMHARQQQHDVSIAISADGRILGVRDVILIDNGAYLRESRAAYNTLMSIGLGYAIGAYAGELHTILTNKPPVGVYRGAGHPEAAFVTERIVELAARHCGEDPVYFRRRHLAAPAAMPQLGSTTAPFVTTGDPEICLDQALVHVGYAQLRHTQAEQRRRGRYLGIGVSCYTSLFDGVAMSPEAASVEVDLTGRVMVFCSATDQGQGLRSTLAAAVADVLALPPQDISVVLGDTLALRRGWGTYASRGAAIAVSAAQLAAESVKHQLLRGAAHLLDVDPTQARLKAHRSIEGPQGRHTSWGAVLEALRNTNQDQLRAFKLRATRIYTPQQRTAAVGTHVALVEVDPETYYVKLIRYVVVDDSGRALDPELVAGQLIGGIVQGIGGALSEQLTYRHDGQLLTTPGTYGLPRIGQIPPIEVILRATASTATPSEALGVGEAGTIAAFATIVTAVDDALAPWRLRSLDPPLTPERLWRAMQAGMPAGSG